MIYTGTKHFSHEYNLKLECNKTPFTCDGCKEIGWGPRFISQHCNYDISYKVSPSTIFHPFYEKCSLKFLESVPDWHERSCNRCGRAVHGCVYHCHNCGTQKWGKGLAWSYRSTCKEYHFHVSCVKDMVVKKWEQEYFGGTELNRGCVWFTGKQQKMEENKYRVT
ncbi:hypothetical protein AQUCO_08400028v1 [Aquilegia coerulea]|uniref:DC1 domain-containing protein n=1 Tax=Aquilegia coerulea TaxID=218851 RepID=A0A2G5C6R8_AQUCA|nr:hypothetical protein AQUCO_08400028v1 [Aquilegia coerulea]